ncbi:MAG: YicC family protein [Bacteroidetes bacterium]|nr:YicC family protein [Bacteroidota bacterium]PHX83090.1 MAG: hypothetical protein CK539_01490 [Flavobacteriales bacterium]
MKSMTGYGKSVCELPQKKITVEIRSLNSRTFDLNIRMPSVYREKESEVRSEISKNADRGKIDVSIYSEGNTEASVGTMNHSLLLTYHKELSKAAAAIGDERKDFLPLLMRMPDIFKQDKQEFNAEEWKATFESVKIALVAFNTFREDEGNTLATELSQRIAIIQTKLLAIATLDPQRAIAVRERLNKHLAEATNAENIDKNRFEQELIYYLEKLDITEEKVRLQTHLDYFSATMLETGAGRKLGFIAQEIGREINTIGSKANDAGIQMIVVQMKDELEKIKEQLLNVL